MRVRRHAACPTCQRHVRARCGKDGVWTVYHHQGCQGHTQPIPLALTGIPILFPSLVAEPEGSA